MAALTRRALLAGTAAVAAFGTTARATVVRGGLPWSPSAGAPPVIVKPGPWQFFTPEEAATIEALVDRLIPADNLTAGGKELGIAVFIDRQLAGAFGDSRALYMRPPFQDGTPQQGGQSGFTPAQRYRASLAALDKAVRAANAGKAFTELPAGQQDNTITALQKGDLKLDVASGRGFFELLLQNTREGFLADPTYGGNKDMASWRMIGFPGARYDLSDWIGRHNEKYPLPPVSIVGRPEWNTPAKG